MESQFIVNGLVSGAGYALIAAGFALLFATTRFYNFAYAIVYTAAPYAALAARDLTGSTLGVAMLVGCAVAVLVGCGIDVAIFRHLRRGNASPLAQMLASLGVYVVLQNVFSMLFGDATRSLRDRDVIEGYAIFGARITGAQLWLCLIALLLIGAVAAAFLKTGAGRRIKAVASNEFLARCVGINTEHVILMATALASLLAGAAGVLVGLDTDLTPRMGFAPLLMGMVASVVGGMGRFGGAVLGAILLGLAIHLGVWAFSSEWQEAIAFGILAGFLLFRPQGIFGGKLRTSEV